MRPFIVPVLIETDEKCLDAGLAGVGRSPTLGREGMVEKGSLRLTREGIGLS